MSTADVAALVRSVLQSSHSELVMRGQILDLARTNLHQPGVAAALLESLPAVRDRETRAAMLALLSSIDVSRLPSAEALHDALIAALHTETERATRVALIDRLARGLHQDSRLASVLVEVLAQPSLSDPERNAITRAVQSLPAIDEATAALALDRARDATTEVQACALAIAEHCPTWGDRLVAAMSHYLEPRFDRALRLRILQRLREARSLTSAHFPLLQHTLRADPDARTRAAALELLAAIKPWGEELLEQLLWTAARDADASLRARAAQLQREAPQLSDLQIAALAAALTSDRCTGVRLAVIDALRPYARVVDVRVAAAQAFASNPTVFDDAEFDALVGLLAAYAGRDAAVRGALLAAVAITPSAAQRARLLDQVVPRLRAEEITAELGSLFERERDDHMRATLFALLKPLSITKHPELVRAFIAELVEPASRFRAECAAVLAPAAELYPGIPAALEDVLQNDRDRELVRTCLEGYLRPRVARRFEPLLAVVANEVLDTASRQRALDELTRMQLDANAQQLLAAALAGLRPNTLKKP